MRLVYEGKTTVPHGRENNKFFVGHYKNPTAVLNYGDIPQYLNEDFWSQFVIWNNGRLTNSLPLDAIWAKNPQYLIDIITAFQSEYEHIMRG